MGTKSDLLKIKNYNEQLILKQIYTYGPIARIELAKRLGLSPTAVSDLTKDLLNKKLIIDNSVRIPQYNYGAGRPARGVIFNANAGYVFIIKEEIRFLEGAILNLDGKVIYTSKIVYDIDKGYEKFIEQLVKLINKLYVNLGKKELWGIGIVIRGVVMDDKVFMHSQYTGWGQVDLINRIYEKYNLKPYVINYPNSAAVGEIKNDLKKEFNNILYVNWGMSIGMGVIINRKLYTGSFGMAGEIGHIIVDEKSDKKCYCGKYGCLEAVATGMSLINNIKMALERGEPSLLKKYIHNLNLELIIRLGLKMDKLAYRKIKEIFVFLGKGLVMLSNIFDADAIILGGEIASAGERFLEILKMEYSKEMMSIPIIGNIEKNRVKIKYTDINDMNVFLGGVRTIVEDIIGV